MRIVTSALLISSLLAPIVIKALLMPTETLSEINGFSKTPASTPKTDIQLLCEEKEKEEEFGANTFQGAFFVTGLIIDLSNLNVSNTETFGVANSTPLVRATPLYLIKQALII